MDENFDQYSNEELEILKSRFFNMKEKGLSIYLDADDYDILIDYFFDNEDKANIELAIDYAIKQHPGNDDFLLKKAHLLALYGKDEQGLKLLDTISNFAEDSEYYMIRGIILSNLQKYREAIEEYTKAINGEQDLEEIYSNIAFEYENLEQYDKAIEYLNKVLDINRDNEAAINEIGICFEMNNNSDESIKYFNRFIDQHPYSRAAWFNLAIAHNSMGKNKKAINAYEFSLAIDPKQANALFNIANIYAGMEQHQKAIDYYQETIDLEEADAITYYYMGESYEKQHLFDEALKAYGKSYDLNNEFHEAQLGTSRCHFIIGDEEKAFIAINKVVDLNEPFPLFWSIRLLKLEELGFSKLAYNAIFKLIKKYPHEPIYLAILASLTSHHDISKAIDILQDTLLEFIHSDKRAIILYLLGLYQMQTNKLTLGLSSFEEAIILDKEDFLNPLVQAELTNYSHTDLKKLIERYQLIK